ncbi:MAG TPA: hypothetical protein PKZ76_08010 [Xanthomonadaceae bacterium]|nr:hypothetical protein [Xanthomonadaceae bacterium]
MRAAIEAANASVGPHTIAFNIPGAGVHTIQPVTPLPAIVRADVVVDGYTQPGASANSSATGTNAELRIELRGSVSGGVGLTIDADNVTVRGLVINRFAPQIQIGTVNSAPQGVTIEGCFIGTDPSGTLDRSDSIGVRVLSGSGHRVGGTTLAARNLISGNSFGVQAIGALSSGGTVQGNLVGTAADGVLALGNGFGIIIDNNASGWVIGGGGPGRNRIAFNGTGIVLRGESSQARINANHIHDNNGLGIDLVADGNLPDGVTPNDPDDADTGPNGLQNFPVLGSARRSSGSLHVTGFLDRPAGIGLIVYLLDWYVSSACDPSGHGEGEEPIATTVFPTASGSDESFGFSLPDAAPVGSFITATATRNSTNETSEFSACIVVADGDAVFGNGFEEA